MKTGIKVTVDLFVEYVPGDLTSQSVAIARAQKLVTLAGIQSDTAKGLEVLGTKTISPFKVAGPKAS